MAEKNGMKLKDRVALITGASHGIGRAIARRFAQEGAKIAAVARVEADLRAVAEEIAGLGGQAVVLPADLSVRDQTRKVVPWCLEALGTIDILVNNAGVGSVLNLKPVIEFDDDFWDLTIEVNLTAPYLLMKAALPTMVAKGKGRIINISSLVGKIVLPNASAYAASKLGLLGLTRVAAVELGQQGVTVNAICPGFVRSRLNEKRTRYDAEKAGLTVAEFEKRGNAIGRRLEPSELTATALLLAGDEGAAIVGQSFNIDGGICMQ